MAARIAAARAGRAVRRPGWRYGALALAISAHIVLYFTAKFWPAPTPSPTRLAALELATYTPPQPVVREPPKPVPPKPIPQKPVVKRAAPKPPIAQPAPVVEPSVTQPEQTPEPAAPVVAAPPKAVAPPPLEPPRFDAAYLDNPAPAYPRVARRRGVSGTVLLAAHITPEGRADQVRVQQTSGHEVLDAAALNAVTTWRFVPARRGDAAVAAWVEIPIVFNLRD